MTEVLETIAPPYSTEFVALFLPLVENEDITGIFIYVLVAKLIYNLLCLLFVLRRQIMGRNVI